MGVCERVGGIKDTAPVGNTSELGVQWSRDLQQSMVLSRGSGAHIKGVIQEAKLHNSHRGPSVR